MFEKGYKPGLERKIAAQILTNFESKTYILVEMVDHWSFSQMYCSVLSMKYFHRIATCQRYKDSYCC